MQTTLLLAPALLVAGLASAVGFSETETNVPVPVPAAAGDYAIDAGHSFVMFKVGHLGMGQAYGQFRTVAGDFSWNPEKGAEMKVKLTIDAASVDTNHEGRDKHLRGADFFSVKEYPEITFTSTSAQGLKRIGLGGDKSKVGGPIQLKGDLTLHGVTKEITVKVEPVGAGTDPWGKERAGFEGTFTIDRMDYGIDYMPDGLGKEVTVMFAFEGTKKE